MVSIMISKKEYLERLKIKQARRKVRYEWLEQHIKELGITREQYIEMIIQKAKTEE